MGEAQLAQPNTNPANLPLRRRLPRDGSSSVERWQALDPPPPLRRSRWRPLPP
jgi:hypothetical protein